MKAMKKSDLIQLPAQSHQQLIPARSRPYYRLQAKKSGFSLIETLISLAIGMAIMMGSTFFLYSITQSYHQLKEDPRLEDHVEGVCALLESFVGTTRQTPATQAKSTTAQPGNKPKMQTKRKGLGDLRWEAPPGTMMKDLTLAFKPQINPIFFSALPGPTFNFDGYLVLVPKEGLFLVYQTATIKQRSPTDIEVFLLSPWVTQLEYGFYDHEKEEWTFAALPPASATNDDPKLPQAIRLEFAWQDRSIKRLIFLQ